MNSLRSLIGANSTL